MRVLILARLGQDQPEDWRRLADGFLNEPPVRDWGTLLGLLHRWTAPDAPAAEPVRELAAFLKADRFDLKMDAFDVSISDDLLGDRLIPAGKLVVRHVPVGGSPVELTFRQDGEGRRERPATVYRFVPDGPAAITYRPGEVISAALPVRAGGREYRLVWNAARSAVYHFDALTQPPALEKIGPVPAPERVPGVRATVTSDGGLPAVPVLVPAVRPGSP